MSTTNAKTPEIKPELKKFFLSPASSSHERMIKELKKLESTYQEKDLGMECFIVAYKLHTEAGKPQDILSIGKRALNALIHDDDCKMPCFSTNNKGLRVLNHNDNVNKTHGKLLLISATLNMLGFACSALGRFEECLSYLTWSNRNLTMLEKDESCCLSCVFQLLHVSSVRLFELKMMHLGKRDEAVDHMRKILEIKEKCMEEGCLQLGEANRDVYYAYLEIEDYKRALPHCLKALEIFTKHLGPDDTTMVTLVRRELGGIYTELGEYDKALEQTQLSQHGLRNTNDSTECLKAELSNALVFLDSRRYDEAVDVFKAVASNADAEEGLRASALISMARAYYSLGKLDQAKKCMDVGREILERKGAKPGYVAEGFQNMSILYEKMKDLENAISFARRVLTIPDIPQQLLVDGYKHLHSLISRSGMAMKGIQYLEDAVKILKERFGQHNMDVGYAYANLGEAYMTLGRPEPAAKSLKCAKAIMDVFLGPNHTDSLKTSQSLNQAYTKSGRHALAIECQEKIVDSLKGLGQSEVDHLAEAVGLLALMKVKAARALGESPQKIESYILESLARAEPESS